MPIPLEVRVTSCRRLRGNSGYLLSARVHNVFSHTETGLRDLDSGYGPLQRLVQLCG